MPAVSGLGLHIRLGNNVHLNVLVMLMMVTTPFFFLTRKSDICHSVVFCVKQLVDQPCLPSCTFTAICLWLLWMHNESTVHLYLLYVWCRWKLALTLIIFSFGSAVRQLHVLASVLHLLG